MSESDAKTEDAHGGAGRAPHRPPRHIGSASIGALWALAALISLSLPHEARALSLGDAPSCSAIGGSWNAATSTCTVSSDLSVEAGDTLTIGSGVVLYFAGAPANQSWSLTNHGTLVNQGTISTEFST